MTFMLVIVDRRRMAGYIIEGIVYIGIKLQVPID